MASLDADKLTTAGIAGVAGGIRASLRNREEVRRFDQHIRNGVSPIEALRDIEERRIPREGARQSG